MFFLYKQIGYAYSKGDPIDYRLMFYMYLHTASVITELYMLNAVCFNAMQQVNKCKLCCITFMFSSISYEFKYR